MPNQSPVRRMRPHEWLRLLIIPSWSGLELESFGHEYRIYPKVELCWHKKRKKWYLEKLQRYPLRTGRNRKNNKWGGKKGEREKRGEEKERKEETEREQETERSHPPELLIALWHQNFLGRASKHYTSPIGTSRDGQINAEISRFSILIFEYMSFHIRGNNNCPFVLFKIFGIKSVPRADCLFSL